MKIKIEPSILKGKIEVPPSKSYSHRAIISGGLAEKNKISNIYNLDFSEDINTTIEIMENWGAKIKRGKNYVEIEGNGGEITVKNKYIQCNESGSSIRFLIPIGLSKENELIFDGKGKLVERPLNTYYKIFDEKNIFYKVEKDKLPLEIKGKLEAGVYEVDGNISSQFITGLLYGLSLVEGKSNILINKKLESKGYVDLTLEMMALAGIKVLNNNYKTFEIVGKQRYKAFDYTVEGDYSQGAFWIVAGIISANKSNEITCLHLKENSLQGDKEIIEIVRKMGAKVEVFENNVIIKPSKTFGRVIDVSQCPDIAPILTVLGALSEGKTEIINGERLRIKESDRITSITTELNKLGAKIAEKGDSIVIEGVKQLIGGVEVDSWNDHRIAMSLGIASTRCNSPILIKGAECVKKSYPHFWEDFKKMGGIIEKI